MVFHLAVTLPAVLLGVGLVLLAWARRGRVVDDHPLCRQCGFDLTGKPADSTACAECGADLSLPRAVRVGHREARRGPLMAAAAVLLLSAGWLGLLGYASVAKVDWAKHKPAWWLVRDAKAADPAARDAALAELAQRIKDGKLPQPRIDELAEHGLAHQANRATAWLPAWGRVVEAVRGAGKLSDERWTRYRLQAGQIILEVRPTVRRGDPLPYYLRQGPTRLGAATFQQTITHGRSKPGHVPNPGDELEIGGRPVPEWRNFGSSSRTLSAMTGGGASGSNIDLPARLLAELPDGPHEVLMRLRVTVSDATPGRAGNDDPALALQVLELRAPMTLVPADQPTATLIADPSHRPAVEKALTATGVQFDARRAPPSVHVSINCTAPPVGLAYDVFARRVGGRAGDREWRAGSVNFTAAKGGGYGTGTSSKELSDFDLNRVDLVFRPSLAVAVRTTTLTQIWGGEVVIKDVPVTRVPAPIPPAPPTQPAAATAPVVDPATTPAVPNAGSRP